MPEPAPLNEHTPHDVPPDVVPDKALENLLNQVADSAQGLAREVGAGAGRAWPGQDAAAPAADDSSPAPNIDDQFAQAQGLLDQAQREIGAADVEAGAPEAHSATECADQGLLEPRAAESDPAEAPISSSAGRADATVSDRAAPAPPSSAAATSRVSRALWAAGIAVRVLDVCDRPFARLGYPARRLIGWCALGTIVVAATALIISLY